MTDSTLSDYSVLSLLVVSLEVNDREMARLNMGLTIHVWIHIVLVVVFTREFLEFFCSAYKITHPTVHFERVRLHNHTSYFSYVNSLLVRQKRMEA